MKVSRSKRKNKYVDACIWTTRRGLSERKEKEGSEIAKLVSIVARFHHLCRNDIGHGLVRELEILFDVDGVLDLPEHDGCGDDE